MYVAILPTALICATDPVVPCGIPLHPVLCHACAGHNSMIQHLGSLDSKVL